MSGTVGSNVARVSGTIAATPGGLSWDTAVVTGSTVTVEAGNGYFINTTSNTCTVTLPSAASAGDQIVFVDYARTWASYALILDSNGLTFQGKTDVYTVDYDTAGQSLNIVYSDSTQGWLPVSDDAVADAPQAPAPLQRGIIFGGHDTKNITNLISNTGVVSADVTAVSGVTGRHNLAGCSFAGDRAIFAYGFYDGGSNLSMSNLTNNSGVISADVTGVGSARRQPAALGYGYDKGIFGFGYISAPTNVSNLVNNLGVVASDATGVGTAKTSGSGTTYGGDKGVFAWGSTYIDSTWARTNTRNLVSNVGIVATTVSGAGTARDATAATTYGSAGQAIFGYGGTAGSGVTDAISVSNKVSNSGVIAADVTGVGTARFELMATPYGGDKGAFVYGGYTDSEQTVQTISIKNLVSNTGVIGANVTGVGTVRKQGAGSGYSQ